MVHVPTAEELRRLTPAERIKKLRELEALRKKELEETRKQVEQEIAAAEELIKETEDETEEQEDDERKEEQKRDHEREEENLEERITQSDVPVPTAPQYETNLYSRLERAAETLENLYTNPDFTSRGRAAYEQSKKDIELAKTYKFDSEVLADDLNLASGLLNRLKYRHN